MRQDEVAGENVANRAGFAHAQLFGEGSTGGKHGEKRERDREGCYGFEGEAAPADANSRRIEIHCVIMPAATRHCEMRNNTRSLHDSRARTPYRVDTVSR